MRMSLRYHRYKKCIRLLVPTAGFVVACYNGIIVNSLHNREYVVATFCEIVIIDGVF